MPTVKRFDPFEVAQGLDLRIESPPFDASNEDLKLDWMARADESDELMLSYDLTGEDAGRWSQLTIPLEATLPKGAFEQVLPRASDPARDTLFVASIRCPSARYRRVVRFEQRDIGHWTGQVDLSRDSVRSVVEIHPLVVRRGELPGAAADGGYATRDGAVIARGRAIRFVVDRSAPPLAGALEMQWEDFRMSSHPWRKENPDDLFYLSLDRELPKLWLNSRYHSLHSALNSEARSGSEAVIRNLANVLIAQTVWMQLSTAALGAVDYDEVNDTYVSPEGWRADVLMSLIPRLVPERNEEDQLRDLGQRFRSRDGVAALMSQLGTAVQAILPSHKQVEQAIRAAERGAAG